MSFSPEALRSEASMWENANYCPGEPGYCRAGDAEWRHEPAFDLTVLLHLFEGVGGPKAWFDAEIEMDEEEGMGRGYRAMLSEDILEEVVVLARGGKGYIWDGWHRVAAALASGRTTLKAIVGTPLSQPVARREPTPPQLGQREALCDIRPHC